MLTALFTVAEVQLRSNYVSLCSVKTPKHHITVNIRRKLKADVSPFSRLYNYRRVAYNNIFLYS